MRRTVTSPTLLVIVLALVSIAPTGEAQRFGVVRHHAGSASANAEPAASSAASLRGGLFRSRFGRPTHVVKPPSHHPFLRCLEPGETPDEFRFPPRAGRPRPWDHFLEALMRRIFMYKQWILTGWRANHCVHLNEIQVLGTHNSYKIQPAESLFSLLNAFLGALAQGFEYTHIPLTEQFESQGIRQIELDVFSDRAGGLYADPAGPRVVESGGLPPGPENDPEGLLREPGLKVLHIQDIDFRSTCLTFVRCLGAVKTWSDAHPRHLPIMILVEIKQDPIPDPGFGFVIPEEFDADGLDQVDSDIRSVFPDWQVITPDEVRGGRSSLEEAVLMDGWPTLAESKGRVLFALDNGGMIRDLYIDGHPSLEGRVLFTNSLPGDPEAAFIKLNDPVAAGSLIPDLVAEGYIVRTRADADTVEARSDDTTRRDAALASGAQYVSTDYPVPNPDFGTEYRVMIPGGDPARCNPINAPADCEDGRLE